MKTYASRSQRIRDGPWLHQESRTGEDARHRHQVIIVSPTCGELDRSQNFIKNEKSHSLYQLRELG